MATVSIVIPCYNKCDYVHAAIESALAQVHACEVIVVDDGSTDASLEKIKQFDGRIRWVTGPNRGGSAARNTGLDMATGDWIQFLDADDIIPPDKVALQLTTAQGADVDTMVFSPWSYFHDDGKIEPTSARKYWCDYPDGASLLAEMWYYGGFFPPHAWLVPRTLIDRVGRWNEALTGDDDGEFFGRVLVAAGYIHFCADTTVLYRDPPEGSVSRNKSQKSALSFWAAFEIVADALHETRQDKMIAKACLSRARKTGYVWSDMPEVLERAAAWERRNWAYSFSPSLPKGTRILIAFLGLKRGLKLRLLIAK